MAEELNVKAMKVAELRAELSKRDLPTTGVKAELVARLTEHLESQSAAPAESARAAPAAAAAAAAPAAAAAAAAPAAVSAPTTAAPSTTTPAAAPAAVAAPASAPAATPASGSDEKSAAELEIERRRARAARFGVPFVENPEEVKKKRAERFGITTAKDESPTKKKKTGMTLEVDPEKLAARAARFGGTAVGSHKVQLSKKPPMSAEELAKMKARADRFGAGK